MKKSSIVIRYIQDIFLNIFSRERVVLISESAHWAIYEDCEYIKKYCKDYISIRIAITPIGLRNKIVHFASVGTLIKKKGVIKTHKSNTLILTWFHIGDDDGARLQYIPWINDHIKYVHTSCTITAEQLFSHGLHREKIVIIPIGVNTKVFHSATPSEKEFIRKKIGIQENSIVIGSFQKDGNGWKEGLIPKLIKGPDIFCDAVEIIAKKHRIHVVLTGPARGYVIKRFIDAGITYSHIFLSDAESTAIYYRALDIYIIASRAEGGPKALLESAASGVALVTTRVGMVPDIMEDGVDCEVVSVEDTIMLAEKSIKLILDEKYRKSLVTHAHVVAHKYDIGNTAQQYYHKIYKKLLLS